MMVIWRVQAELWAFAPTLQPGGGGGTGLLALSFNFLFSLWHQFVHSIWFLSLDR